MTVPDWLSDTLCRVSTGLGFSTRTLYENDEETLFDACRPIVINGIGVLGTRSDLLDRTIELELPRIPDDRRQDEAQFWAAFDREQPAILSALLDAVSGAIGQLDAVKLERAPRMADFGPLGRGCRTGARLARRLVPARSAGRSPRRFDPSRPGL